MEEFRESYRNDLNDLTEDVLLPTISLIHVPHPTIPNLYQRCFEYVDRGQWDCETELVATGRWYFKTE
jgi:hypothetical protein